jgi:large subunit ribosomal protein L15
MWMVWALPHKLKKTRKQRGSRTMGYGRVGQHRKAGGRGGKGKAGGRKHFWIRTVKYEPERYMKIGFKPPSALEPRPETINIGELEDLALQTFGAEGLKAAEPLDLDLTEMGYGKLLGRGEVSLPLRVRVSAHTPRALEKIEATGGEIIESE